MSRIVMFNRVSADGYFAAADGNLAWMVPDDALDEEAATGLPGAGTMIFGRTTYDGFESFWPSVVNESTEAPDPHTPGRKSPELRRMAQWIHDAKKIVYSKKRKNVTWKNSELVHEFDPGQVEGWKRELKGDIMVFGSGTIVSLLTKHRLIDEYHFIVAPVFLGGGKTLIRGVELSYLKLLEAKPYPSGTVKLRYTFSK
jgi:dihydrofolate reductase